MVNSIYKSEGEWKKISPSSYNAAQSIDGLIPKLCEEFGMTRLKAINKLRYWTKERCIAEAKLHLRRIDWSKKSVSSYNAAVRYGWLEECCAHMDKKNKLIDGYWTDELIQQSTLNFTTKKEWIEKNPSSYHAAAKRGIIEKFVKHMTITRRPNNYWTFDRCYEVTRNFSTIKEWGEKSSSSYSVAKKRGWVDELSKHMVLLCRRVNYWTKERCGEAAKKFNSRIEWFKKCKSSYGAAQRNGWIDELTTHMVPLTKTSGYWTFERCLEEAKKYSSITEWAKNSGASCNAARKKGWFKECSKHMIKFKRNEGFNI